MISVWPACPAQRPRKTPDVLQFCYASPLFCTDKRNGEGRAGGCSLIFASLRAQQALRRKAVISCSAFTFRWHSSADPPRQKTMVSHSTVIVLFICLWLGGEGTWLQMSQSQEKKQKQTKRGKRWCVLLHCFPFTLPNNSHTRELRGIIKHGALSVSYRVFFCICLCPSAGRFTHQLLETC